MAHARLFMPADGYRLSTLQNCLRGMVDLLVAVAGHTVVAQRGLRRAFAA
jgi:hypothetical protein